LRLLFDLLVDLVEHMLEIVGMWFTIYRVLGYVRFRIKMEDLITISGTVGVQIGYV